MDYAKCVTCKGAKKIKGLGGMERNCPGCKGIGYKEIPVVKMTEDKIPGKRGRPAKKINQVVL